MNLAGRLHDEAKVQTGQFSMPICKDRSFLCFNMIYGLFLTKLGVSVCLHMMFDLDVCVDLKRLHMREMFYYG